MANTYLIHTPHYLRRRYEMYKKMKVRSQLACLRQELETIQYQATHTITRSDTSKEQLEWLLQQLLKARAQLTELIDDCNSTISDIENPAPSGDATPDSFHGTQPPIY